MIKNTAGQKVGAQLVTATDGSAFTSAVTVEVTLDAGTQATGTVGAGACTHEGNGYHTYAPSQAETNGDLVAFTFHGTGAIAVTVQVYTRAGDAFSRLGAPAGASVSSDIAAVKVDSAAILVDTGTTLDGRLPAALVSGRMDASVGAMAANVLTATAIAADAITDAKVASDVTIASVTGSVGSVVGAVGSVTGSVGSVTGAVGSVGAGGITAATIADGAIDAATFAAGAINAAAIASDAITDAKVASDVTIASVTGAVGSVIGTVGSVTGAVGSVTGAIGSVGAGGITSASFATDALTAAKVAADVGTEIAAAVLAAAVVAPIDANIAKVNNSTAGIDKLSAHLPSVLKVVVSVGSTTTAVVLNAAIGIDGAPPPAINDFYNGRVIVFTSGALAGQSTDITDYVGSTVTLTVTALTGAPASGVIAVMV